MEPDWEPRSAQLLSCTVGALALCCPRKDTPTLAPIPSLLEITEHGESQSRVGNATSIWGSDSTIYLLQVAFLVEMSARHLAGWRPGQASTGTTLWPA